MSDEYPYFLNEDGKTLEIMITNNSFYGKWINNNLTLFFEHGTDKFIGCEIYLGKDYEKVEKALEKK